MRYEFGPTIVGTYPRPVIDGELPDIAATSALVQNVQAADPGLINYDVIFAFPAADPTQVNVPLEAHAVAYAPGHGIPTDPALAVTSSNPKGMTAVAIPASGGIVVVTVADAPSGNQTIVTVLGFADATAPPDPTGSDPAPAADPTAPATTG